ncbi:MAG: MATE family efflux transporter [Myxococcota bacterium]
MPAVTSLPQQVFRLAWPVMLHMLLTTVVFLVGRAMVGRHSSVELASMQISGPALWSVHSVFSSFSAGTLAVVGRCMGARDRAGAASAYRASLALAVGVGLVITVPALVWLRPLVELVFPSAESAVKDASQAYLSVVLLALPLMFVETVSAAALQAAGDTRTPLRAAVLANIINVGISAVLIFGLLGFPELGIRGAGIGAATALGVEGLLLLGALLRRGSPIPVTEGVGFPRVEMVRVLRVSGPAFVEKTIFHTGYMGYVALIGMLGAQVMAANQALLSIESISFLSADGFGIAAGALMAQKLGARNPDEAGRAGLYAAGMSVALLSCAGIVFASIPATLVGAFTSDPAIIEIGTRTIMVGAVAQPFMGFAAVMAAGLRGAGDTRTPLSVTCICVVVVRLSMCWFFGHRWGLGLMGIWIGSTIDWACRALLLGLAFRKGRWRELKV